MSEAELTEANEAWRQAESAAAPHDQGEQDDEARTDKAIVEFMRKQMKWAHRDIHDAFLAAGVAVPSVPSMRNYLASLRALYGDADTGFLPRSFSSHNKTNVQYILRILARGGAKLGGRPSDRRQCWHSA